MPIISRPPRTIIQYQLQVTKSLFSSVPTPSHNHIARLILNQKSASQALQTFTWASRLPNFRHSHSANQVLICKLCVFRHFGTVHQLLEKMPTALGSPLDDDTFVTLIRGLPRAHMIRRVINVLDLPCKFQTRPFLKIFNSILNVPMKENIDITWVFYRKKMMVSRVEGDDYTFGILMKRLCSMDRIADAFKLLQVIKSQGIAPNVIVYNTLLHALCKNGKVGRARSLMNEIDDPSDVTFNVMISARCVEEYLVQALVMLDKCFSLKFMPDVVTVTKVLESLCSSSLVSEAVEILERVENIGGLVSLLKGFCKLRKARVKLRILKEMERKGKGCLPNVDTDNVLINGFCESEMLDSTMDLFNDSED